jgi:outer membrane protein assembly factor BamA
VRLETDFTKTWSVGTYSSLVGHINAGVIFSYGNSAESPFTEMFYAGGANSIRAFPVREVGPGQFTMAGQRNRQMSYLMRNGDLKFIANLEYRQPLFGNLHGAAFIDIGNTWHLRDPDYSDIAEEIDAVYDTDPERAIDLVTELDQIATWINLMKYKPSRFFEDIAVGTGIGLRYDLGFLVIRLDWGFVLHNPEFDFNNEHHGYFNFGKFKDMQTLHFAIGYPF